MTNTSKSLADQLFPVDDLPEDLAVLDIPPEKRRLITETYDFSINTLHEYLVDGSIYVPMYQRKYVWNRAQASRLIESLIIQCPIPTIYLNQENDERLAVVDGNQRLTSIRLFLEDDFQLRGLTAYPELEGLSFSQLDPRFKRHIKNRTLRCITIQKETHPQIKFDVFERINTGAVQLNPQEVRHGVFHGSLMKLIDDLASEKLWTEVYGRRSDPRMKGAELILRFLAMHAMQDQYRKPLSGFLNLFCEKHASMGDEDVLEGKVLFLGVLENIHALYGSRAFHLLDANLKASSKNINSALFDAQMISMSKLKPQNRDIRKIPKTKFFGALYELQQDEAFREAILSGTSATSSVNYRIKAYTEFMRGFVD